MNEIHFLLLVTDYKNVPLTVNKPTIFCLTQQSVFLPPIKSHLISLRCMLLVK